MSDNEKTPPVCVVRTEMAYEEGQRPRLPAPVMSPYVSAPRPRPKPWWEKL